MLRGLYVRMAQFRGTMSGGLYVSRALGHEDSMLNCLYVRVALYVWILGSLCGI